MRRRREINLLVELGVPDSQVNESSDGGGADGGGASSGDGLGSTKYKNSAVYRALLYRHVLGDLCSPDGRKGMAILNARMVDFE